MLVARFIAKLEPGRAQLSAFIDDQRERLRFARSDAVSASQQHLTRRSQP